MPLVTAIGAALLAGAAVPPAAEDAAADQCAGDVPLRIARRGSRAEIAENAIRLSQPVRFRRPRDARSSGRRYPQFRQADLNNPTLVKSGDLTAASTPAQRAGVGGTLRYSDAPAPSEFPASDEGEPSGNRRWAGTPSRCVHGARGAQSPSPLRLLGGCVRLPGRHGGRHLPSPLYGLYRTRDHLSALTITVVFAIFAAGTIACCNGTAPSPRVSGAGDDARCGRDHDGGNGGTRGVEGPAGAADRAADHRVSVGLAAGTAITYLHRVAPARGSEGLARPGRTIGTSVTVGALGIGPLVAGCLAQWGHGR